MPSSPSVNPLDTRDPSASVDKVNRLIGSPTEKQLKDENNPSDDSQKQAENIRTLSVSPPQSAFTFKLATPSLILTSPTPPEGYRVGRTKRRRRQSKANKAAANDRLVKPDNPRSTPLTTITDEQQAAEVTAIPTESLANQASTKRTVATDRGIFPIPSVRKLTGKTWDTPTAPRAALIENPASSEKGLDYQAHTQADAGIEDAAESRLRQSYAAVTASQSHTSIDTTVHIPPTKPPVTASGQLYTDLAQDWPSSLPTPTGPILPATKSRRSRFFPRQSPPGSPAFRARHSSSTFRHPRFRERAKTVASAAPPMSKTGLPTPPPSQDPSFEVLVPSPVDDPSQQSLSSQAEIQATSAKTPSPPKLPRTTPWKWWRGDLSRLRSHSTTSPSPFPNELELVKPTSLERVVAKDRLDSVPALGGEWEFVSSREGLSLRGGGDGEECEGSDGEWIWRCGEGCRCMRRGCAM